MTNYKKCKYCGALVIRGESHACSKAPPTVDATLNPDDVALMFDRIMLRQVLDENAPNLSGPECSVLIEELLREASAMCTRMFDVVGLPLRGERIPARRLHRIVAVHRQIVLDATRIHGENEELRAENERLRDALKQTTTSKGGDA